MTRNAKGFTPMDRQGHPSGFTLVELIIVISVIAILVGIALPRLRGMIDEGNTAKAASELRALQAAMESYYVHNSKVYPPATGNGWETLLTQVKPTLVGSEPKDPFHSTAGTDYGYVKSTNGKYYVLWSVGSDTAVDVTGISDAGVVTPSATDDDIYISNGTPGSGGF